MGSFKNLIFFLVLILCRTLFWCCKLKKKEWGKKSNTLCAMQDSVDFGSVDFKTMLVYQLQMQMQIVGFISSYFMGSKFQLFLLEMDFSKCCSICS